MEHKAALLDQLRIDRPQSPPPGGAARRGWRGWLIALSALIAAFAAAGVWFFAFAPRGIPVHAVMAKQIAGGPGGSGGAAAGGSLLDASGYVVALREATVSAKSIYKVNEVLVQEGQPVKHGQVMARLDDTNARAALEQSEAQVKQLQAALVQARLAATDARPAFLRDQKQLAEGLISQESFDTTKANYDALQTAALVAEQNVAVAKAAVAVYQRYVDDTVIKAPFDGVVTVKSAQPGEIVSPQFSGGGGIAKIVDMTSLEVDVDVSENFINRVHSKQSAIITLNAYPDWQIPAEVIAIIPTADQTKATVKVRVGFKQRDARVLPEMGARVAFLDDGPQNASGATAVDNAVLVPAEAVEGQGASGTVFVIHDDTIERRSVRLGARTADGQTILSGLTAGTSIVLGDFGRLSDGSRVHVVR